MDEKVRHGELLKSIPHQTQSAPVYPSKFEVWSHGRMTMIVPKLVDAAQRPAGASPATCMIGAELLDILLSACSPD